MYIKKWNQPRCDCWKSAEINYPKTTQKFPTPLNTLIAKCLFLNCKIEECICPNCKYICPFCKMYFKRCVEEVEWTEVWLLLLEVCWDKLPKIPHTIKHSSITRGFLFHKNYPTIICFLHKNYTNIKTTLNSPYYQIFIYFTKSWKLKVEQKQAFQKTNVYDTLIATYSL